MSGPGHGGAGARAEVLTAAVDGLGERLTLVSPGVGHWTPQVVAGQIVQAGEPLGVLTVLGVAHRVVAGPGARGAVLADRRRDRRIAVGHGEPLVVLDRLVAEHELNDPVPTGTAAGGLAVKAPSSGRFYGRPAPGKPAFVAVGDRLTAGQVVGLLEVMKTFHRVTAGDALPPTARVVAIVADDTDVDLGDTLLWLEEAP